MTDFDYYVFGFNRVCDELSIDPGAARPAINKKLEGKKPRKKMVYGKSRTQRNSRRRSRRVESWEARKVV